MTEIKYQNILLNHHVKVVECEGKKLLEIDVPAADRHDKPVYIGTDPMRGTYRRDYEGDFLCTEAAVRAMFADQRDDSVDSEILEDMGLDALNTDTIKGYSRELEVDRQPNMKEDNHKGY